VSPAAVRLAVLALIWGCSFLFIKIAVGGLVPLQVAFGRMLLGALVLAAVVAARRDPWPSSARVWGHLAVLGLVSNAVPFTLFAVGEQRVSSGLAGVFNATTPLWTALLALPLLPAERLTPRRLAGLLLGFAGVLVLLAPWRPSLTHRPGAVAGEVACLLAAASYGLAFVYTRRYLQDTGLTVPVLAASQLACGTVELGLAVLVAGRAAPRLDGGIAAALLALGVVGTGLAYLLNFALVRDVGATRASTVTYLIPLVAVTLGLLALGERLAWTELAGMAVVLAGVALTSRHPRESGRNRAERAGMGPPTVRT